MTPQLITTKSTKTEWELTIDALIILIYTTWLLENSPSLTSEVMFARAWRSPIVPQALPTVCFIKYTLLLCSYTRTTNKNPTQGMQLNNQRYDTCYPKFRFLGLLFKRNIYRIMKLACIIFKYTWQNFSKQGKWILTDRWKNYINRYVHSPFFHCPVAASLLQTDKSEEVHMNMIWQ